MSDTQFLILEDQLLDHLSVPASALVLYRERFSPDYLLKDEILGKEVLEWVFDFIVEHGMAPSTATVKDQFVKFEFHEPEAPVEYVIEKFRNRYKRNQLEPAMKRASKLTVKDPDAAVKQALSELHEIHQRTLNRKYRLDTQDWNQQMTLYKEKVKAGHFNGITLGYPEVDEILGGLRPGTITYMLARPKRYKSWSLMKSAVEAQWQGHNVYFASLELTHEEMYRRYMAMVSNVSWLRLHKGQPLPEDFRKIEDAMEQMREEGGKMTLVHPEYGERSAAFLLEDAKREESEVMYIDQLSYMEMGGHNRYEKDHEKVKFIAHELKHAADTLPIFIAAQFNREGANLTEMADTAKIGLSDAVGQTADLLLGNHQTKEMRQSHILQFGVVDSRNTEVARWNIHVRLNKECQFELIERVEE